MWSSPDAQARPRQDLVWQRDGYKRNWHDIAWRLQHLEWYKWYRWRTDPNARRSTNTLVSGWPLSLSTAQVSTFWHRQSAYSPIKTHTKKKITTRNRETFNPAWHAKTSTTKLFTLRQGAMAEEQILCCHLIRHGCKGANCRRHQIWNGITCQLSIFFKVRMNLNRLAPYASLV